MKKAIVLLSVLLIFCLAFSACGDNTSNNGDTSATKKPTATATSSVEPTAKPTAEPPKNVNVHVFVEDILYSHVVEVKYNDEITTWDRLSTLDPTLGYDKEEFSLDFTVPNDGTEVELTAVIRENAPYKITGWSGDFTADGDTIKFTPAGKTIFLTVKIEPLYDNVALNSTVTSSVSTVEYEEGRWGMACLTDGDANTRFSTATLQTVDPETMMLPEPVTIDIDLTEAKSFDTICLIPRVDTVDADDGVPCFPSAFEVLLSNDGTEYSSVLSVDAEKNVDSMMQIYAFAQQSAQYLRIKVTRVGTQAADEGGANPDRVPFAELLLFDAE